MSRLCSTPTSVVPSVSAFPAKDSQLQKHCFSSSAFCSVSSCNLSEPGFYMHLSFTPYSAPLLHILPYSPGSWSILLLLFLSFHSPPPVSLLASSILPHCPIFSFILTGFPHVMLSPLFQLQDLRSGADFQGTHIFAGPAHGRQ